MRLAVWCEFLPYADVIPVLPDLAARNLALHLAIGPDRRLDPNLFGLLAAAASAGVEVRAWVLLREEDGYWPNAWNADRAARAVREVVAAAADAGTPVPWVILDLEPPPGLMQDLGARLGRGDLRGAWRLLAGRKHALDSDLLADHGRNPDSDSLAARGHGLDSVPLAGRGHSDGDRRPDQVSAGRILAAPGTRIYGQLIADLHARGTRVQAVTLPMALDGPAAHRLLAALGIPLFDLPWDEVTFMAYRPEFVRLAGPMGADLVARYARAAVRRFGPVATLAIGEVGSPGFPVPVPGYTDPADLQADLAACRAAGLTGASIFSLDGVLEQGGLAPWFDRPAAPPPVRELRPALLRLAIDAACRLLPSKDSGHRQKAEVEFRGL